MSFEDAVAELSGAIEEDSSPTPEQAVEPAPTTPEGTSTTEVQPHHAASQPRDGHGRFVVPGSEPVEPQVADTFDDGQFNPDTLPPELQPGWKQLQGAFTRKTQELAERSRELEGIDVAQARQALEFVQQLQDPNYLVEFHQGLSEALQAQGLTPAQADAVAAQHTEEVARGGSSEPSSALAALREYPELSGVADYIENLEKRSTTALERVEQWEQSQRENAEMARAQEAIRLQQLAGAAELQRQEMAIIAANKDNPNFTVETTPEMEAAGQISDLDAIYALAGHTDGDLFEASKVYDQILTSGASRYFGGKESSSALPTSGTTAGASQTSEIPSAPADLEAAQAAAEAYLRGAGITHIEG